MGNVPINKINFEVMQTSIKESETLIINTLPLDYQDCLILNTISANEEIALLNKILKSNKNKKIIIYGINACDQRLVSKYNQLIKLGFNNIFIYPGGLFEWVLLQDIYGDESFPTTRKELDILRFK
jgi:hypothetical protein